MMIHLLIRLWLKLKINEDLSLLGRTDFITIFIGHIKNICVVIHNLIVLFVYYRD